jgi:hypothetical protein
MVQILEGVIEPVAHLIADDPADADPARLGKRLQTCCDVDPIAENVLALGNDVAEVNPNAELDPFFQ